MAGEFGCANIQSVPLAERTCGAEPMAGSMVRGLLGSGLPASYLVITLCAPGWALSFPSPVSRTVQDPLLPAASSCLGRG